MMTAAQVAAGASFSYNAPEFLILRIGLLGGYTIVAQDLVLLEAGVQKAVSRWETRVQLLSQELQHEQAVREQLERGTYGPQAELEVQLLASKAAESALQQILQQKCNELLLLSRQLQDAQHQLEDSQQSVAAADHTLQELRSQVQQLQQQLAAQQQQQQQHTPAEVSTPASCKPQAPLLLEVPTGPDADADTDTLRHQDQRTPQHTPQAGLRQHPLQDPQQQQRQEQHTRSSIQQLQGSNVPTLRRIPSPLLSPSALVGPKHSSSSRSGRDSSQGSHQPSGCDSGLSPSPLPGARVAPVHAKHSRGRSSPLVSPSSRVGPVPASTALGRRSSGRVSPLPSLSPLADAPFATLQRSSGHSSPLVSPSSCVGTGPVPGFTALARRSSRNSSPLPLPSPMAGPSAGATRRSISGRDSLFGGLGQQRSRRIPGAPEGGTVDGTVAQAAGLRGSRDRALAAGAPAAAEAPAAAGAAGQGRSGNSGSVGGGSAAAGASGSVTAAPRLPVFKFTASSLNAISGPKPFGSIFKPFTPGVAPSPGSINSSRFGSCGNGSISGRARRAARAAGQHASSRPPKHKAPAAAAAGAAVAAVAAAGGRGGSVIGGVTSGTTPKRQQRSQGVESEVSQPSLQGTRHSSSSLTLPSPRGTHLNSGPAEFGAEGRKRGWR